MKKMIRLMKNDDRESLYFLNYPRPTQADPLRPMGPNGFNEALWPVEISEDGKTIGLSTIRP